MQLTLYAVSQFIGDYEIYDHDQFTNRPQIVTSMNSRATLSVHDEHNIPTVTSFIGATNSKCSSRSENYCCAHHGPEMSAPTSQRSSVTINMTQKSTNEVATNGKMEHSPSCSVQMPMADHHRDTPTLQIIPRTQQAIDIVFTTGDETNV